jgi:hypothetical protein
LRKHFNYHSLAPPQEKLKHITTKTKAPQRRYHKKKNTPHEKRSNDQPQVGQSNKRASNASDSSRLNMTPQQTLSDPT